MEPNQDQAAPESAPVINEPPKAKETPVLGSKPAEQAPATVPAAPKKSSNAGLIVAIIIAILILAGGIVTAILILTNSNNGNKGDNNGGGTSQQGGDNNGGNNNGGGTKTVSNPEKSNDSYFIDIDGVKIGIEDKISKFEKTDFDITEDAKNRTAPANKYYSNLSSEFKSDDSTVTFDYTAYNNTDSDIKVSEAKLGSIEIQKTSKGKASDYKKITFYGGIHIGSSRDDLIEAFGEPEANNVETENGIEIIKYVGDSYMRFEFELEDDAITKIRWVNYTNLLK